MRIFLQRLAIIVALSVALAPPSHAIPVIEFEFLGSGMVFSPTDTVIMRGRVTNMSAEALTGAVGQGFINFPSPIFDQYFDPINPPRVAPPGVINMAPSESIEWTIYNFIPFPLTGNLGDPVALGDYVFSTADIVSSFFVPLGPASFTVVAQETNATNFTWRVVDGSVTPVPEPAPFAMFLAGVLVLTSRWLSRRQRCGY